jgi:hypothetical protein
MTIIRATENFMYCTYKMCAKNARRQTCFVLRHYEISYISTVSHVSVGEWLVVCFLFTRSCHGKETENGRNLVWLSICVQSCINVTCTYLHRLPVDLLKLGKTRVIRRRTRWLTQVPEERIELAINRRGILREFVQNV